MEERPADIISPYPDEGIDAFLASLPAEGGEEAGFRYTQDEDLLVRLPREIELPPFPIHHDIARQRPGSEWREAFRAYLEAFAAQEPAFLSGMRLLFDPSDIFRPSLWAVEANGEELYLRLLSFDLSARPASSRVLEQGSNDRSPRWASRDVFIDSRLIPLASYREGEGGRTEFGVRRILGGTWLGETGKGYMLKGIWMDRDLSKFFSRLFGPPGQTLYPFFPLDCRYQTVCAPFLPPLRARALRVLPFLSSALAFLEPEAEGIQAALRSEGFSETMEALSRLRGLAGTGFPWPWEGVKVRAYLDERDAKEYAIELPPL